MAAPRGRGGALSAERGRLGTLQARFLEALGLSPFALFRAARDTGVSSDAHLEFAALRMPARSHCQAGDRDPRFPSNLVGPAQDEVTFGLLLVDSIWRVPSFSSFQRTENSKHMSTSTTRQSLVHSAQTTECRCSLRPPELIRSVLFDSDKRRREDCPCFSPSPPLLYILSARL